AACPGDVGLEGGQPVGIEVVGEHAGSFRAQLPCDLAADPLARPGDEHDAAVEPAPPHRPPPSAVHSSMPSTITPSAALGWMSQRPWAPGLTGGRSMIGTDFRSSALPLATTSSVTTARW